MTIREIQVISEVRGQWLKLMEKSETGTVFQHPVFLETWWEHFGRATSDKLQATSKRLILGAHERGALIGIGAFEIEENFVRFLGMRKVLDGQKLTDYGDIVARSGREEEVWKEFISYIRDHISDSELVFDYVREDSPSFKILPKVAEELNLTIDAQKQEVAPHLLLPASWEEYVNQLERKKRHELRRKLRRFEEGQTATFKVLNHIGEAESKAFVKLMRASSEEKRAFMNEEMAAFFGKLLERSVVEELGMLAFLETEKRQLGSVFLLRDGKKLLGYNGGSIEVLGQAVGVVMTAKLIEWAISQGFTEFDFLRGGERYKYDLGAGDRQLWQIRLRAG